MKPFDLEKAIAGEKLVTRDGREVTEFHHFKTARQSGEPFRAVINGLVYSYETDGMYMSKDNPHDNDLFMAVKARTGYLNVYDLRHRDRNAQQSCFFDTEADARRDADENIAKLLLVAHPVEIEE